MWFESNGDAKRVDDESNRSLLWWGRESDADPFKPHLVRLANFLPGGAPSGRFEVTVQRLLEPDGIRVA